MDARYALCLVLNAHLPFVREQANHNLAPSTIAENWFFEVLSETYLPLLELFDRLEMDSIPFKIGLSISPILGQMMSDGLLLSKYTANLDHQIEFGERELERLKDQPEMLSIAKGYFDRAVDRRAAFSTRYDGDVIKVLDHYCQRGNLEIIACPATHAFLPSLCQFPEAAQAQMEAAQPFYRYSFGLFPRGLWLPELGWSKELDSIISSFGYKYTVADSHGFIFGNPPPSKGSFFPVRTPESVSIFSRDYYACREMSLLADSEHYRDNSLDIGFELPTSEISQFLTKHGARCYTGYKYWKMGGCGELYDPERARRSAYEHAKAFYDHCRKRLITASKHMQEMPVSVVAFNADAFGRYWHEGSIFLENLFRLAAKDGELPLMTPSEYLGRQNASSFEVSAPDFSTWGSNGYAEQWLDSSNDWVYRHLNRASARMMEMAENYDDVSDLKERALNQAARELMLAQASDWPAMLQRREHTEYARKQIETALRNFNTIYNALSTSNISTEWLIRLERRHNIFPHMNYRIFRRKQ